MQQDNAGIAQGCIEQMIQGQNGKERTGRGGQIANFGHTLGNKIEGGRHDQNGNGERTQPMRSNHAPALCARQPDVRHKNGHVSDPRTHGTTGSIVAMDDVCAIPLVVVVVVVVMVAQQTLHVIIVVVVVVVVMIIVTTKTMVMSFLVCR